MADDVQLHAGERVVWQSKRGGDAGYSPFLWILFLFGGLHIFGSLVTMPLLLLTSDEPAPASTWVSTGITAALSAAFLVLWLRFTRGPAYFVTDRRIIARRFLRSPLEIDPRDVGGAARFRVVVMRYGRVVSENYTHRIVVALRSGGVLKIGPVKEVDELLGFLHGLMEGTVDLSTLPDVNGGLARAEERTDLFFARGVTTAGAPRGPLFVGPTKIIGFAERLLAMRVPQMLSIAGAHQPAEEIEERMLSLAQNAEWGRGKSVVMEREGVSLGVEGQRFIVGSGATTVAFDLSPGDAARAAKFVKASQVHPYRA